MAELTALICPKCRGQMRSYERAGIVIDQCEECRGIFLDRGELERLLDAESGRFPEHGRHDREHDDRHDQEDEHGGHDRRRGRASTLFSDLLGGD